jgi:hypothetical protein
MFPAATGIWSDGENWATGHWLNGRLGAAPLDRLVAQILGDAGIAGIDTDALRGSVDGYLIDRPLSPRGAIDPIARAYTFDAIEDGEIVRFRPRGGAAVKALTTDELVRSDDGSIGTLARAQETELPREVSLSFTDTGGDFRRSTVTSRRLAVGSTRVSQAELAIATSDAEAQRRAEVWLQDVWVGREQAEFRLPPSRLDLTPGDVVSVDIGDRQRLLEIRDVVDANDRRIKARAIFPPALNATLGPTSWRVPELPVSYGPPHVVLLDLPSDAEPPVLQQAAVYAKPWPGAVTIWRSVDGATFERFVTADAPAVIGETLDALPRGVFWRWDRASKVRVKLFGGALATISEATVLGGGNLAAIEHAVGAWEIVQFGNATLVAENTYELSNFLRGQHGTEWLAAEAMPAGAAFVVIDPRLRAVARGADAVGRSMQLRVVAAELDHGDASAVALVSEPSMTALKPLSPVHVAARRTADGVRISWIRRTRQGGDSWEVAEVPLGEEQERYEVDIFDGDTLRRTLNATQPEVLYRAADESADFGAEQSALSLRVYQMSVAAGRGTAAITEVLVVA